MLNFLKKVNTSSENETYEKQKKLLVHIEKLFRKQIHLLPELPQMVVEFQRLDGLARDLCFKRLLKYIELRLSDGLVIGSQDIQDTLTALKQLDTTRVGIGARLF